MSPDEWRWSDEQGVQRLVRLDELRQALATRVLPASTPVWRQGMAEWLPAEQVSELQSAVAGPATGAEKTGAPRRTLLGVQAVKPLAPKPTQPLPRFAMERNEPPSKSAAAPAPRGRDGAMPSLPRPSPSRPAPAAPARNGSPAAQARASAPLTAERRAPIVVPGSSQRRSAMRRAERAS